MKKHAKYWGISPVKSGEIKPSEADKQIVTEYFQSLVEAFKAEFISKNPNKEYRYLVDIYSKWYQSYFYLCEKQESENPNRIVDEFEIKTVRLKYTGKNQFDFAYFRHTGQWHLVARGLTMEECREMILSNPVFQPIG